MHAPSVPRVPGHLLEPGLWVRVKVWVQVRLRVGCSGFNVWGVGFRVKGSGFGVNRRDVGFRVKGLGVWAGGKEPILPAMNVRQLSPPPLVEVVHSKEESVIHRAPRASQLHADVDEACGGSKATEQAQEDPVRFHPHTMPRLAEVKPGTPTDVVVDPLELVMREAEKLLEERPRVRPWASPGPEILRRAALPRHEMPD